MGAGATGAGSVVTVGVVDEVVAGSVAGPLICDHRSVAASTMTAATAHGIHDGEFLTGGAGRIGSGWCL